MKTTGYDYKGNGEGLAAILTLYAVPFLLHAFSQTVDRPVVFLWMSIIEGFTRREALLLQLRNKYKDGVL